MMCIYAGKITGSQVAGWTTALETAPTHAVILDVVEAFRAAVAVVGAGTENFLSSIEY